jgi:hypothetical protein
VAVGKLLTVEIQTDLEVNKYKHSLFTVPVDTLVTLPQGLRF